MLQIFIGIMLCVCASSGSRHFALSINPRLQFEFSAFCFECSSEVWHFATAISLTRLYLLDFISLAFPKHLSLWNLIVICLGPLLQEPAFLLCFTASFFGCFTASPAAVSSNRIGIWICLFRLECILALAPFATDCVEFTFCI